MTRPTVSDGKSALLTLKLKADSGYRSEETHRIDAGQWSDILLICADQEHRRLLAAAPALLEALKPFAAYADFYDSCEQHPGGCPDDAQSGEVVDLTVGDFRRARAALAQAQAQLGEG